METITLNFYDIKVGVSSQSSDILEEISRDFSYFLTEDSKHNIKLEICLKRPEYGLIPSVKASSYLPDAVIYSHKGNRYVDYNTKALTIYNYGNEEGRVYSEDKNLLHEITYLLILSRVGEMLDKRGFHRVHCLGISIDTRAILCLLPAGAGKTTLALDLLKEPEIRLLSDDTVLLNKGKKILPFPLRLGVNKEARLEIPTNFLRDFVRRQYGQKTLIDIEYFKERIAGESLPWIILVGEREFSDTARIRPISKFKAIGPFIQNCVIGLGLAQMIEYFLRHNLRDLGKITILFSRLAASLKIIGYSRIYEFSIGQNKENNAKILMEFLRSQPLNH